MCNMLLLVVGHLLLPTFLTFSTHMNQPCLYFSNPYHHIRNCPSFGQFSNFSNKQMNTSFSYLEFESNSNFYNLEWSNHSNLSWKAQARGNYAPQFHELHHLDYPQFDNQFLHPSSYNYPPQQLSLEDTLTTHANYWLVHARDQRCHYGQHSSNCKIERTDWPVNNSV
jgi:hypothetical protein